MKVAALAVACLAVVLSTFTAGTKETGIQETGTQENGPAAHQLAESIFDATGVQGGLVVHLGCGTGRLTAALRKGEGYMVHGLDAEPTQVDEARAYIRSLGLYGPVSAERWDAPLLPYVDNTVNLLVVETPDAVSAAEMTRVLVPGGVAYVRHDDTWTKTVRPPREGVDEWTHYLHDASGNPVAHDSVVGPPRHLQWTAQPRYGRSHEYTPSTNAVVSAGNRIFYIADRGPIATLRQPAEWNLVARDAYNGILLWERPIDQWFSHLFSWTQGPRQLQRKLIAVGDRVYGTLGFYAPLVALDAATGETLTVYPDTEGTDEILCQNGVLLLVVRNVTDARRATYAEWDDLTARTGAPLQRRETREPLVSAFRTAENRAACTILAVEADTGQVLWKKSGEESAGLRPLSLRACGDRVYCEKRDGLNCFDLQTGKTVWTTSATPLRAVSENALACVDKQTVSLLSPEDGKPRWSQPVTLATVRDVFLIGDSLWLGGGKPYDSGNSKNTGPSWGAYFAVEYDVATGDLTGEITAENPKHHHRCYENKATDRYILGGRRGTEFLDLESRDYLWHSWARGTCRYGVMPCNGMLYLPPHACGCYITAKLVGFNALAPARPTAATGLAVDRLEKGPAYGSIASRHSPVASPADWVTYRGDAPRSGLAGCTLSAALTPKWQTQLDGTVTAPTVALGKAFVARPDQHELVAIDTHSGKTAWTFTTGGPIDSPPTIHGGRILLGCRDGYVYCLRASDGELAWRFLAAGDRRRIVADGRIESASPVHGSVLVDGDTLCLTAGRSSYLDGGLDLYRLNPATGEELSKTDIYSPDPETGRQPEQYGPADMPGARSDILAADDQYVYLRDLTFTKQGTEIADRKPHLFTLTDFLDDTWTHRSYWIFGTKSSISTGCSGRDRKLLYGRLLVFDDTTVYGYGRETVHWSSEFEDGPYRLFARKRDADQPAWSKPVPIHIRAMVLAGDVLFAAGAGAFPDKAAEMEKAAKEDAAKKDADSPPLLLAISASDGSELARYPIAAPPVFDGMAAAQGELLLTLENGQVLCMAKKGG